MYLTSEHEHAYRFEDHGPKYLTKGPNVDMGVVVITPKEEHPCHMHEHQEESFLALEGECSVYVDGVKVLLRAGDYLRCNPGESHYFFNESDSDFKAVVTKAPHLDYKDSVYLDWKPGSPFIKQEIQKI
jgi:quercetin dioxygenase-like cupin family protein